MQSKMLFDRYGKDRSPGTSTAVLSRSSSIAPTEAPPGSPISASTADSDAMDAELQETIPSPSNIPSHLPPSPKSIHASDGASRPEDRPLACMFYFFHSQMSQHTSTAPDPDLVSRRRQTPDQPVHRLDTHLTRLQMHAAFSPLVKSFDRYPVAIDPTTAALSRGANGRRFPPTLAPPPPSLESHKGQQAYDTVLLMRFRSKRAREEWMVSREWQEFYRSVEGEKVCRRMPHVRCARSIKGLMDVRDVLTA